MTTAVESARSEMAAVVGESHLVSDAAACALYAVDGKVPRWVAYPSSAEQVAAVLKCAAEQDLAVIPCRNATKLAIGNPPRRYDVALSLKEMNRVWHYEPADLTVTLEPGMKLGDFQHFVGRHRLWLPLDPAGGSRASLGGILATNSAGPLRLHYGAPRDMVLGMKIATTEGKVIKTGGRVVKNVAGYDLGKLLIGSYGTLGIIVEVSLKLYPLPSERATFVFPAPNLDTARNIRRRILRSPLLALRMIHLDREASTLTSAAASVVADTQGPEMWVEAGGTPRVIERIARELEVMGRGVGTQVRRLEREEAERAWAWVSDFQTGVIEAHPGVIILKAALPSAASEEFLSRALKECENAKERLASFGQTGVGVVYVCLVEVGHAANLIGSIKRLRSAAEDLGGALVIERAPNDLKAGAEVWGTPGDDFGMMWKLKAAWDPKGILAPGRFVGGV